jgi:hypothetical protein
MNDALFAAAIIISIAGGAGIGWALTSAWLATRQDDKEGKE